jgi:hypothetical protein
MNMINFIPLHLRVFSRILHLQQVPGMSIKQENAVVRNSTPLRVLGYGSR